MVIFNEYYYRSFNFALFTLLYKFNFQILQHFAVSISIKKLDNQHNETRSYHVKCHLCWVSFMLSVANNCAECHYAECRYAECCGATYPSDDFKKVAKRFVKAHLETVFTTKFTYAYRFCCLSMQWKVLLNLSQN